MYIAAAVDLMGKAMSSDTGGAGMAGVTLMLTALAAAIYVLGKNAMETRSSDSLIRWWSTPT